MSAVPNGRSGVAEAGLAAVRSAARDSLLRNGVYIMGTTAVTSLLGFGFWLLAANLLPAAAVGQAAALVAAMQLVAVVTNLGIGQVLISRLPSRADGPEWSLTVTTGLLVTTLASLVGGLLAAAVVPLLVPEVGDSLRLAAFAILPLGVAGIASSLVLDFACIAERRARPSFLRNASAALARLALLAAISIPWTPSPTWLLAIWAASFVAIDVDGVVRILPALGRGFRPRLRGWRREALAIRRLVAGHQAINLGSQALAYLLPVVVAARLGPTDNAHFYATFMLASGIFFIAPAIGNSLFAEGAHDPAGLLHALRRAARYVVLLATPPALVLLLAGPSILELFGAGYSEAGTTLLYVLIGTAAIDAAYQLAIAVLRAEGRLRGAALATWALLLSGLAASWLLLPPLGLPGAGVGWAAGKALGLFVALFFARGARPPVAARPASHL